jgi:carbonic anhydrase
LCQLKYWLFAINFFINFGLIIKNLDMSIAAKEALDKIKAGNEQYVEDKEHVGTDKKIRESLITGQDPYAIVLSCADSRVVPESIFDANAGELFVLRVAGNIANTSTIASIEYAVAHLGTKLIVVLGHESCGAVTAALAGGDNGYNLNHLCSHIVPAIAASESSEVNDVVRMNAKVTCKDLVSRSEIISNAVKNGLEIVSAYYNLSNGKVDIL